MKKKKGTKKIAARWRIALDWKQQNTIIKTKDQSNRNV